MSPNEDRRQRDFDLLAKSHRALQAEQRGEAPPAEPPKPDQPARSRVVQYRGRPVRTVKVETLREALAKLADLHAEGLISSAEFESKRRQILDRL